MRFYIRFTQKQMLVDSRYIRSLGRSLFSACLIAISVAATPQPASGQVDNILNQDHAVAKKALAEAIVQKDFGRVRLGLRNYILTIKIAAAEALGNSGQQKYVVDLANALEANRGIITGGTETQLFQRDLNISLIRAIERLTNIDFGLHFGPQSAEENSREFYENLRKRIRPSDEDILKVIEKTRNWRREQFDLELETKQLPAPESDPTALPLEITFKNLGKEPARILNLFDIRHAAKVFFIVTLVDSDGTPVLTSGGGKISPVASWIKYVTLKPGEQFSTQVDLRDYLAVRERFKPGVYEIQITYRNQYGEDCFQGQLESKRVSIVLNSDGVKPGLLKSGGVKNAGKAISENGQESRPDPDFLRV